MEIFKRLQQFYWPDRHYLFGSLLFLVLSSAITVVYPIVLQLTIDQAVIRQNFSLVPILSLGFVLIMAVKGLSSYFSQYWGDMFGVSSVFRLREALYKKLQYLPYHYYDNAKTGDLMSRLTADVEGFRFFLSAGFTQLVNFVVLVGFSIVLMFYYSWELALVTLAMTPFLCVSVFRFDKRVHPAFRKIRLSLASMNTRVQENISGMSTIKSLGRENYEIGRFAKNNKTYRTRNLVTADIWAKYFPLMELIGDISVVLLLALGGYFVMSGRLDPGALVAFFSLVWYIMDPLMNLGFMINTFSQSKASGERLLQILDEQSDITSPDHPVQKECLSGNVAFRDVSLIYPNEKTAALSHVCFEAKSGNVIGLMGATGSGKTSITQLIGRFYDASCGEVLVDECPVKLYDLNCLRSNIGYVLQENFLFSSTIRDNIAYGKPEAALDEVIKAAKRAEADEFIQSLPNGYDTVLGERGMGLSGGQKQRISIARALLVNPSILILDDATSAVDMRTEGLIQKAFKELMKGRTTFIIAHRISSLQMADQILVLDHGRIKERGTHNELVRQGGIYRRIYDIQYKDRDLVKQQIVHEGRSR
ncbi:ABC transporter ATP-binding protein/permease [Sporolactobacillus shoreicorticis]|uniref:ABC transporter ATP-binding protein n=1 Tax=Sporolactobacillus shoreicorticis TaxID=1923877 RepID=A0ABW5S6P5_9BACL|nr:ABC transporter ATP-binding protein [Sporolactobacillus shoreicorticis]MCO7126251.1 ABC transporter ATP-binding protein/permease [Sporolactobacillus shoreicorticis]